MIERIKKHKTTSAFNTFENVNNMADSTKYFIGGTITKYMLTIGLKIKVNRSKDPGILKE